MRRSLLNQRRVLLLLIAALLVAALAPVRWTAWLVRVPQWVVETTIAPPTDLLGRLGPGAAPGADPRQQVDAETLRAQINELQRMNYFLHQQLREAHEELALMRQITVQLGLERPPAMLAATVTARDARRGGTLLTINRGSRHGLRDGLTVAAGRDLVGEVVRTGPLTATVRVMTHDQQTFEAIVAPPDALNPGEGVSHLWLQYSSEHEAFFTSVAADADVEVGHYAISQRPRATSGFIIGRGVEVQPDPEQAILRRRLLIRPRFDIRRVDRVIVVVRAGASSAS